MKTYFDHGAAMEFSNKGPQGAGYTVRIAKEGFSYKSLNGKVDADVKFAGNRSAGFDGLLQPKFRLQSSPL